MIENLAPGTVPLVSMAFGSEVNGTGLASSDRDVKGVFLPAGDAILLQRVRDTISHTTKLNAGHTNSPSDVDTEYFSLQRYLSLLVEGQTNAIDMLFTPAEFYLGKPHAIWEEIVRERRRFLHSGVSIFARYCRRQAARYGIKGSRIAALRSALAFLSSLDGQKTLSEYHDELAAFVSSGQAADGSAGKHIRLVTVDESPRKTSDHYFEVAGRKVPVGVTVKLARSTFQRAFDQFGQRALLAEKNQGIDWKALMHAVRVATEAKELLLTGCVTFPRPERDLLLDIRKGQRPYEEVADRIEKGVEELEEAVKKSTLPANPDRAFVEALVCRYYSSQVQSFKL